MPKMISDNDSKIKKTEEQIKKYDSKKEKLKSILRETLEKQKKGEMTYTACVHKLNNFLEGKSIYEWMGYYDKCKKTARENISEMRKEHSGIKAFKKRNVEKWKEAQISSAEKNIAAYEKKEDRLKNYVNQLDEMRKKGSISYSQYQYDLNNFREGKSVSDWVSYYRGCRQQASKNVNELESQTKEITSLTAEKDMVYSMTKSLDRILEKDISVEDVPEKIPPLKASPLEKRAYRMLSIVAMTLVALALMVIFNPDFSTVATIVLDVDSVYTQPFNIYIETDTVVLLSAENLGELKSFMISGIFESGAIAKVYLDDMLVMDTEAHEDISFVDVCEETCSFEGLDKESYNLKFEVTKGVFEIKNIKYVTTGETSSGFDIVNVSYPGFKIDKPILADIEEGLEGKEQLAVLNLNHDTSIDIAFGIPEEGNVYIWYGDIIDNSEQDVILGSAEGFGYFLDVADVNHDMIDDLIVWVINDTAKELHIWYSGESLDPNPDLVVEVDKVPIVSRSSLFVDVNRDRIKDLVGVMSSEEIGIWYGSKSGFVERTEPDIVITKEEN